VAKRETFSRAVVVARRSVGSCGEDVTPDDAGPHRRGEAFE
jgi:hypothetical protein